jgi:ABC-type dipeptide/oligopeptide/nickel transport system ATPase component
MRSSQEPRDETSGILVTADSCQPLLEVRGLGIFFRDLPKLGAREMRRVRGRRVSMIFQEPMSMIFQEPMSALDPTMKRR